MDAHHGNATPSIESIPSQKAYSGKHDASIDTHATSDNTSSRRLTRSQSGSAVKRKTWDDKFQTMSPESKAWKRSKRDAPSSPISNKPPDETVLSHQPTTDESIPECVGPLFESSHSAEPVPSNRGQRSTLPVPVPNLTKKSRGRRVPTLHHKDGSNEDENDSVRTYVCHVEGCGKCFHRGEHLKRHIRSIHTHEKPFKCEHPDCPKMFNRHDNLLQHLKVHKDLHSNKLKTKPKATSSSRHRHVSYDSSNESSNGSPTPTPSIESRQSPIQPSSRYHSQHHPASPHHTARHGPHLAHGAASQTSSYGYTSSSYLPPSLITAFYSNSFRLPHHSDISQGLPLHPLPSHLPGDLADDQAYAAHLAVSSVRTEMPSQPSTNRSLPTTTVHGPS